MHRQARHAFAAALLLAAALAGCGGGSDSPTGAADAGDANATDAAAPAASTPAARTPRPAAQPQTATPAPPPSASPTPTRTPVPGCPQGPAAPPATYYGFGLDPGDVVASLNTRTGCEVLCEQAVVDSDGLWVLRIAGDNVCGVREGDVIEFTVNGQPTAPTETWAPGGVPTDAAQGITLR